MFGGGGSFRMSAPDAAIQLRRKKEQETRVFVEQTQTNKKLMAAAQWDISTSKRIAGRVRDNKINTMRAHVQQDLQVRRQRLASMLAQEEAQYSAEMAALQETTDQRAERLKRRARELIRRREEERRAIAEEKDRQKFRDNSDLFRLADSQRLLEHCQDECGKQLEYKAQAKIQQAKEDAVWHQQYLKLGDQLEEREQRDIQKRKELQGEMLEMLEKQVAELNRQRDEAARAKQEAMEAMDEEIRLQEEDARRKDRERKEMFARKQEEMTLHNHELQKIRRERMDAEREEDLRLLNDMLAREKAAEDKEKAYKNKISEQARRYREQLIELMKKEAVSEAESEAIRQADQDRAWKKREDQWEREREYRKLLLEDVMAVRRKQIAEKMERARRDRDLAQREQEQIIQLIETEKNQARAEKEDRQWVQAEHRRALENQITEHKRRMHWEEQQHKLELRAQQDAEKQYVTRMETELAKVAPIKNHGIKASQWYT